MCDSPQRGNFLALERKYEGPALEDCALKHLSHGGIHTGTAHEAFIKNWRSDRAKLAPVQAAVFRAEREATIIELASIRSWQSFHWKRRRPDAIEAFRRFLR